MVSLPEILTLHTCYMLHPQHYAWVKSTNYEILIIHSFPPTYLVQIILRLFTHYIQKVIRNHRFPRTRFVPANLPPHPKHKRTSHYSSCLTVRTPCIRDITLHRTLNNWGNLRPSILCGPPMLTEWTDTAALNTALLYHTYSFLLLLSFLPQTPSASPLIPLYLFIRPIFVLPLLQLCPLSLFYWFSSSSRSLSHFL